MRKGIDVKEVMGRREEEGNTGGDALAKQFGRRRRRKQDAREGHETELKEMQDWKLK